ncbi:hypothetical protein L2E82_24435 [Cichorium intybus]|uniref:Uncharacterized protein n=1 Tax=Cichorium intybus TaxID=13427 RepID=A0ACB9E0U6_CICIN|nr:hypothetical protein L2E82_24435 [Cichorium intybus]
MAEITVPVSNKQVQSEEEKLKYLTFVQVAAKNAVPYASKAYDYAKENSGSLKPGVEAIEGTLKTVLTPALETFHDVPAKALKFVDRKVDESVTKAMSTTVANDIKNHGVVETASGLAKSAYTIIEPTAKELLVKYEPVLQEQAASAWQSLNKITFFHNVAKVVIPIAAFLSETYNETVQKTAEEGCQVSSYQPLVPTEKIAKVFKAPEGETELEPAEGWFTVENEL